VAIGLAQARRRHGEPREVYREGTPSRGVSTSWLAREPRAVASETRHPASACVTCSLACSLVCPLVRSTVRPYVRAYVRGAGFLYVSLPLSSSSSGNLHRVVAARPFVSSESGTFGAYLFAPGTSFSDTTLAPANKHRLLFLHHVSRQTFRSSRSRALVRSVSLFLSLPSWPSPSSTEEESVVSRVYISRVFVCVCALLFSVALCVCRTRNERNQDGRRLRNGDVSLPGDCGLQKAATRLRCGKRRDQEIALRIRYFDRASPTPRVTVAVVAPRLRRRFRSLTR